MAKKKSKNGEGDVAPARHFRDRILRLDRVRAGSIASNAKNWREHPDEQKAALEGVLEEIGWSSAVVARERPDGSLELVDGHLRTSVDPDEIIPVLVVDVSEEEADKLLTVFDPISQMAQTNGEKLSDLLSSISYASSALDGLLESLNAQAAESLLQEIATPPATSGGSTDDDAEATPEVPASSFVNVSFPVTTGQEMEIRTWLKSAKQRWGVESSGMALYLALKDWSGNGEDQQEA